MPFFFHASIFLFLEFVGTIFHVILNVTLFKLDSSEKAQASLTEGKAISLGHRVPAGSHILCEETRPRRNDCLGACQEHPQKGSFKSSCNISQRREARRQ